MIDFKQRELEVISDNDSEELRLNAIRLQKLFQSLQQKKTTMHIKELVAMLSDI